MRELAGRGWRVLGYFVWMLGVGVSLDSDATRAAGLLLTIGGALFALGSAQSLLGADAARRRPVAPAKTVETAEEARS